MIHMHSTRPSHPGSSDPRRERLHRLKFMAAGLLVASGTALTISQVFGGEGGWEWVHAFAEAAIVGGLADWFAVVALFRHPMGLPIPHTAIIPKSKERIADGLAIFVRDHFLDPRMLLERIQSFDPASRLAGWLRDPQRIEH